MGMADQRKRVVSKDRITSLITALRGTAPSLETELRALRPASPPGAEFWEGLIALGRRQVASGDVSSLEAEVAKSAAEFVRKGGSPEELFVALSAARRAVQRALVKGATSPAELLSSALEALDELSELVSFSVLRANLESRELAAREAQAEAQFLVDLLAHDVANIHTAASGYLQLLAREPGLPPHAADYAAKATERLRAADNFLSQARKFARARSQRAILEPVELRSAVTRAIAEVVTQYRERRVEFRQQLPSEPVWVNATALLSDLVVNLLTNAAKFDRHEPPLIDVALARSTHEGARGWTLRVSDRGPGIAPELRGRIFERFSEGKRAVHGAGLGLSIVRTLIDAFGGKVWVEDRVAGRPAEGASFVVWLQEAVAPSSGKVGAAATPSAERPARNG